MLDEGGNDPGEYRVVLSYQAAEKALR